MSNLYNSEERLKTLAEIEGQSIEQMLGDASMDSVAAGICTTPGCDYTTEVEPDQDKGWCEECEGNTVVSCLILAGVM